ncbi:MAG: calcium-binding protein [Caulobacteraceae bacterium]
MANISGGLGNDTLHGGLGADSITGLDGNDSLFGEEGADTIIGGLGDDAGIGGPGNDLLFGGDGNDVLHGNGNDDVLNGDAGDDTLLGQDGADTLIGGKGSDSLLDTEGSGGALLKGDGGADVLTVVRVSDAVLGAIIMEGGAGADTLSYSGSGPTAPAFASLRMLGGSGNDTITFVLNIDYQTNPHRKTIIDAGSGDDTIHAANEVFAWFWLGDGQDAFVIDGKGVFRIEDFQAGDLGDHLNIDALLENALTNWDGSVNPFSDGHFRLIERNCDARLLADWDGGGNDWQTMVFFSGVAKAELTAFNVGGYNPDGSPPEGASEFVI